MNPMTLMTFMTFFMTHVLVVWRSLDAKSSGLRKNGYHLEGWELIHPRDFPQIFIANFHQNN